MTITEKKTNKKPLKSLEGLRKLSVQKTNVSFNHPIHGKCRLLYNKRHIKGAYKNPIDYQLESEVKANELFVFHSENALDAGFKNVQILYKYGY